MYVYIYSAKITRKQYCNSSYLVIKEHMYKMTQQQKNNINNIVIIRKKKEQLK